jgi:hypothetical protein
VQALTLLDWFRMRWRSWFPPGDDDLDRAIASIAVLIGDESAFRAKAREVAARYGQSVLADLRCRFHHPAPPPPDFTSLAAWSAWLSYWQFAIFEVIYQFRERGLPLLREVAFGEYDWTQGNAIEILCRLAAVGIDRDRTLADLKRAIPALRDTALIYAAGPLLQQSRADPALAAVVSELCQVDEFAAAVEGLRDDSQA